MIESGGCQTLEKKKKRKTVGTIQITEVFFYLLARFFPCVDIPV